MAHIAENILEEVLGRSDIVELISNCIPLKRAGRNFKALCPFHQEKTPSFMVSPERQIFHCFGCQAGGNAISFLMRYEHLEFREAVEYLAKKVGLSLPRTENAERENTIQVFYKINELASNFYQNLLYSPAGAGARRYLAKRQVNDQTQRLFQLGLATEKWDALMNFLRGKNYPIALLEKSGLVIPKGHGGYYDRFRNRIIFPIIDAKSRTIGFGARMLVLEPTENNEGVAKYINSPQTPIYEKGRHFYGFNLAKDAIIKKDAVVIVEGYFDMMLPYQEGLDNIVASLGTALTSEQAKLIKRYTNNVIMVYDGDDAGQLATLRSLDIFLEEDIEVKVVGLPKGHDPDSYVRKYGIKAFSQLIDSSQRLFDYKLNILKARYNLKEVEGKNRIAQELLAIISKFKNPVLRTGYVKRLAEELNIPEDALLQELKKVKNYRYSSAFAQTQKKIQPINPTEGLLIKLMLEEKEMVNRIMQILTPADFRDERTAKIVTIMFDLVAQGKKIFTHSLLNYFKEENLAEIVCGLTVLPDMPKENKEQAINDCIRRIKQEKIKATRDDLHREIKLAQDRKDEHRLQDLMQQFCRLTKEIPDKETE